MAVAVHETRSATNLAAVLEPGTGALTLREDARPEPGPDELVARVVVAGVCGTDAHRLAGDVPGPGYALNFGHEAVGVVDELGPGLRTDWAGRTLAPGHRIYWFPATGCGRCYHCVVQNDTGACRQGLWPPRAGTGNPAGFQQWALLGRGVAVFRIPDGTPDEAVIAFGCAMPTALGGLERLGPIRPGDTVVVQGSGPVGLAATLLAGRSSAREIVVVGGGESRLTAARRLGATLTLPVTTSPADRHERIMELTSGRGADVVIEAAGVLPAFAEGLDLLGRNARYLLLGLYSGSGTVPVDPVRLNNLSASIIGSLGSRPQHVFQTIEVARRWHDALDLTSLVTHRTGLDELAVAVEAMRTGAAVKAVVEPNRPIPTLREDT